MDYRDLYRAPVSGGYYTSRYQPAGYGVADPLYTAYTRVPLDAYAGYAAPPVSYQPEPVPLPRYSAAPVHSLSPRRHTNPRRRPLSQSGVKPRPQLPAQSLAPNRKSFKKTQKNSPVEILTPRKGLQRNSPQRRPKQKEQKRAYTSDTPQKSSAATLAQETQDLHSLFRTGVDPSSAKKTGKPSAKKADGTPGKKNNPAAGQKRKADSQKKDEAPSSAKKTRARGRNRKLAKVKKEGVQKEEKPVASTPKKVKADPPVLTEEEKQEMEVVQNAACMAVGEFLGVPLKREEAEKAAVAKATADEVEPGDVQVNQDEAGAKLDEVPKPAPLMPEEEKKLEAEGYQFFSKLLEDNLDLRKLYLDKKDAGTFECLVCHSVDPETSKKFANLTSLVMHTSMRKQKRPEHRGYGQAICDVLGWESLRGLKQPAKQAKDGDTAKQPEAPEEVKAEENQEGPSDE